MRNVLNSPNLKIQDDGGRHLEFRKNVNNSGLNIDVCTEFGGKMHHGHAEDHVTKSRNWKLIRVTSSSKCREQKGVDLSDYNRYLNQISYTELK